MSSISSVSSLTAATAPPPAASKPQGPPPPPPPAASTSAASSTTTSTLTEAELLQEPISQLTEQAQSGNQLAAQLLAQEQAANTPLTAAAASGASGINILA